jgi:hypothetical protein
MLLERAVRRTVSDFLERPADALGVCITLRPGDPFTQAQRFDVRTDGMDGGVRELAISYLSPRFFTLLILTGDARTALRWGGPGDPPHTTGEVREVLVPNSALFCEVFDVGTSGGRRRYLAYVHALVIACDPHGYERVADGGKNLHPLVPDWMGQVGFAMLLCSLASID